MMISKQIKAKRVLNKALWLLLMLVFGWKENEIENGQTDGTWCE